MGNSQRFQSPFGMRDQSCKGSSKREQQKHDAEQQRQPNDHQDISRPRPVWRDLWKLERLNHGCPYPVQHQRFTYGTRHRVNHGRFDLVRGFTKLATVLSTEAVACTSSGSS